MNVLWERTKMIPRGVRGLYPPPRVGGWKGGSCQQEQESRILPMLTIFSRGQRTGLRLSCRSRLVS